VGADAVPAGVAPLVDALAGDHVAGAEGEAEFDGATMVGIFDQGVEDFGVVAAGGWIGGDGDEGNPAGWIGGGRQGRVAASRYYACGP